MYCHHRYSGMASNSRAEKKGRRRSREAMKATADSAGGRRRQEKGRFEEKQSRIMKKI